MISQIASSTLWVAWGVGVWSKLELLWIDGLETLWAHWSRTLVSWWTKCGHVFDFINSILGISYKYRHLNGNIFAHQKPNKLLTTAHLWSSRQRQGHIWRPWTQLTSTAHHINLSQQNWETFLKYCKYITEVLSNSENWFTWFAWAVGNYPPTGITIPGVCPSISCRLGDSGLDFFSNLVMYLVYLCNLYGILYRHWTRHIGKKTTEFEYPPLHKKKIENTTRIEFWALFVLYLAMTRKLPF